MPEKQFRSQVNTKVLNGTVIRTRVSKAAVYQIPIASGVLDSLG